MNSMEKNKCYQEKNFLFHLKAAHRKTIRPGKFKLSLFFKLQRRNDAKNNIKIEALFYSPRRRAFG